MSDSLWPHELQHARFPCPSPTPEFTQTHVHWVGDAIQPSHPLLSPSPPTFNFSQHQGLSNESVLCIRWPKYWSFSFSINPSNEYSGLISFRMDWLDLFAVQETLKSKQSFLFSLKCVIWQVNEIYPFCKTFRHSINVCLRHLWNENFKCRIHCFIIIYS